MISHAVRNRADLYSLYQRETQQSHSARSRYGSPSGSTELEHGLPTKRRRGEFVCEDCDLYFTEKRAMNRHKKESKQHLRNVRAEPIRTYRCEACPREFAREHDLRRHRAEVHEAKRRRPGGVQVMTTMFHRPSDGHGSGALSPVIQERIPMNFRYRGYDEVKGYSARRGGPVSDLEIPPDVTMPSSMSRRSSLYASEAMPRSIPQYPPAAPAVAYRQPSARRQHTLAISTNIAEYSKPKPVLIHTVTSPIQPMQDDTTDDLDLWLNDSFNHFFQQLNDQYKLMYGASSRSYPTTRIVQCPVCRAPHEDITKLFACMAAHFNEPLRTHICTECQFGFVRKSDLDLHLASVRTYGHCGFRFPHQCTGHHHRSHGVGTGSRSGTGARSLHERMEAWYLLTLFFKTQRLSARLDTRACESPSDRRWTLAALRSKYRTLSVASSLNVRSPTMPTDYGNPERHFAWHFPAVFEETLGKITQKVRDLKIPPSPTALWREASFM